ncbi:predicted protein [Postia placenta Mad-698-R]|nr:predicted protein [Postia placenta Mad-698-R]
MQKEDEKPSRSGLTLPDGRPTRLSPDTRSQLSSTINGIMQDRPQAKRVKIQKTETLETLETLAVNPIHIPQSPECPFGGARSAMLSPPRSASLSPPCSTTLSPRPACTHAEILNTEEGHTVPIEVEFLHEPDLDVDGASLQSDGFDVETHKESPSVTLLAELSEDLRLEAAPLATEVLNNMVFDPELLCDTSSVEPVMPLAMGVLDKMDFAIEVPSDTSSTERGDSFALTAFGIPLTTEILDNLVFDPESSCDTSNVERDMPLAIEVLNNMVFDPEPLRGTPSAELAMPLALEILDNIDLATDVQMESLGDDTNISLNYVTPVMEVFDQMDIDQDWQATAFLHETQCCATCYAERHVPDFNFALLDTITFEDVEMDSSAMQGPMNNVAKQVAGDPMDVLQVPVNDHLIAEWAAAPSMEDIKPDPVSNTAIYKLWNSKQKFAFTNKGLIRQAFKAHLFTLRAQYIKQQCLNQEQTPQESEKNQDAKRAQWRKNTKAHRTVWRRNLDLASFLEFTFGLAEKGA